MKDTDSYRRRCARFCRSRTTMDLRDPVETRLKRAAKHAKRNKTCGRKAVFL